MACQRRVWPTNGVIMFLFWNRFSLSLSLSLLSGFDLLALPTKARVLCLESL
jgi:hypothetical protein